MIVRVNNNIIQCFNCYQVKELLKDFGFKWNKEEKAWESIFSQALLYELKNAGFKIIKNKNKQISKDLTYKLKEKHPEAFDHQINAAALAIQEKSFLIGDEPGVGKTFTALIYADYLLSKKEVDIVFIFCPASIKRQWQQEVSRWLNKTAVVINGTKKQREKLFRLIEEIKDPIVILNYELLLTEDVYKFLNSHKRFALILDEASRLKNHKSKTYKAIKKIASKTDYKLAMTGTPIENSLQEFWAIGYLLRGKDFMSFEEFEENHIYYSEIKPRWSNYRIKKISGYRNIKIFLYQIEPFYIRRKKSDIKEMPSLTEYTREISLSQLQKEMERYIVNIVQENIKNGLEQLAQLSLLRVIADDPRLLLQSTSQYAKVVVEKFKKEIQKIKKNEKVEELKDIIQEHSDKKIVILTQFKKMANLLYGELSQKEKIILITGDDSNDQKAIKIGKFKNKDFRLLIGTDALTYGVSIDEADVLINFDIPWSVGKIIQRRDRIYRISSTRSKWIYYLVSDGTEKKVWEILQSKKNLFNQVVEGDILGDIKNEIIKSIGIKKEV